MHIYDAVDLQSSLFMEIIKINASFPNAEYLFVYGEISRVWYFCLQSPPTNMWRTHADPTFVDLNVYVCWFVSIMDVLIKYVSPSKVYNDDEWTVLVMYYTYWDSHAGAIRNEVHT